MARTALVSALALLFGGCIFNGSFETPPVQGYVPFTAGQALGPWRVVSGSVDAVHDDVWQPSRGAQSIDLTGTTEAGRISQDVLSAPGQHFRISFMMAGNPDGPPALKELQVFWDGVQVGPTFGFDTTGHSRTDMGWVPESVEVTATGGRSVLEFQSLTAPFYGPVIDDVRVDLVST